MIEVVQRLTWVVREGDVVARLGGDEHAMALVDVTASVLADVGTHAADARMYRQKHALPERTTRAGAVSATRPTARGPDPTNDAEPRPTRRLAGAPRRTGA